MPAPMFVKRCGPRRVGALILAGALLPPLPSNAQGSGGERLADTFTIEPTALVQLDVGGPVASSSNDLPGGGANFRRARLGVAGDLPGDIEYTLEWDFGGRPGSQNRIYEASVAWTGIDGLSVRAGAFEPNFSLQLDRSAEALLFLERSAVVDVAKRIAADTARLALQARANGDRWFVSAAVTGGQAGPGYDGSERGAVLRVAGLPVQTDELTIFTGASIAKSFRPKRGAGADETRGFSLSATPELSLDPGDPPLDTGGLTAKAGHAAGLEAALSWRRWQAQGEAYRIGISRHDGSRAFHGWYAQVSHVLLGRSREYQPGSATWDAPRNPDEAFDPAAGQWGTIEAGARYSLVDLNDRDVRGGRQRLWTAGLAWWPVPRFALQVQYQAGTIQRPSDADGQRLHSVGLRAQVNL